MVQKLIKPILGTALIACMSLGSYAQDITPGELARYMTDNLSFLQMTDQQTSNAQALNKTAADGLMQLAKKAKQDTTFKGRPLVKQVLAVMKKRNDGLTRILSPTQLDAFQAHRVEQFADMQTRTMIVQLDLTDDQIPQVYDLNLASASNTIGDIDDMQHASSKWKKSQAGKTLKKDSKDKDEAMKQLLSPDQFSKYQQNKAAIIAALKEQKK